VPINHYASTDDTTEMPKIFGDIDLEVAESWANLTAAE
jgi:hypothetical protein